MKPFLRICAWTLAVALVALLAAGLIDYKGTTSMVSFAHGLPEGWLVIVFALACAFFVRRASARWPQAFRYYGGGYVYAETDEAEPKWADPTERALNAEDLLCQLLVYARENPDGRGLVIPRFLVSDAERLVPDWRQRRSRINERRQQEQTLESAEGEA